MKRVWIFRDNTGEETAYLDQEKAYKDAFSYMGIPGIVCDSLVDMLYDIEDIAEHWFKAFNCEVYSVQLFE